MIQNLNLRYKFFYGVILLFFILLAFIVSTFAQRFAVIGDYGLAGQAELDISNLIKSWNADFIITTGDNNYPFGDSSTIDQNIGQYYHEFIYPYNGSFGQGDTINRFFPSLGNHDMMTANGKPYFDYFTLPNNERYYEFVWGNVHFFALNSDQSEIDGTSDASVQAQWLKNALCNSNLLWKIVYFHHAPYSSGNGHGNSTWMQWPFKDWGATAVIAGHDHLYERIIINNFPYFVNGLGGNSLIYPFGSPVPGSQLRYNNDHGAMLIEADPDSIIFKFINRAGVLIDQFSMIYTQDVAGIKFFLQPNYPNPFNSKTTIRFLVPQSDNVKLKVFNIFGKEITTLLNNYLCAGLHTVDWYANGYKSGIYLYCLYAGGSMTTKKAVIINQ